MVATLTLSPKKMMDPGVEPFTAKTLGVVTDGALHVASMEWSAAPFCPLPDTTTCTLKKSGAPGVNVVGFVVVDENVAGGGLPFCDQRKVYDEGANRAGHLAPLESSEKNAAGGKGTAVRVHGSMGFASNACDAVMAAEMG